MNAAHSDMTQLSPRLRDSLWSRDPVPNRLVLMAFSICSLLCASEKPAKPPSIYPNNGIGTIMLSADMPQGHCIVNLNGDLSATYLSPPSVENPEAHVSMGSAKEKQVFAVAKKVFKTVKSDEAEPVTTARPGQYADAYRDYVEKIIIVIVPTKGSAKAYKRAIAQAYKDSSLRELDQLLTGFCRQPNP